MKHLYRFLVGLSLFSPLILIFINPTLLLIFTLLFFISAIIVMIYVFGMVILDEFLS